MKINRCMLGPAFPYQPGLDHYGHGTDGITKMDYFVAAALACTPMCDRDGNRRTIPERASYAVSLAVEVLTEIDRMIERERVADLEAERVP